MSPPATEVYTETKKQIRTKVFPKQEMKRTRFAWKADLCFGDMKSP